MSISLARGRIATCKHAPGRMRRQLMPLTYTSSKPTGSGNPHKAGGAHAGRLTARSHALQLISAMPHVPAAPADVTPLR